MVKKNNNNKSVPARGQNKKARKVAPAARGRVANGLDASAAAYARMIMDPCNAPMLPPTYSGMGTGQYRRYRTIITIPALAVEGTYMFTPGYNTFLAATHVVGNVGLPYTFNQSGLFGSPELDNTNESRCLAACVKVRYIGTEGDRKGTIGLRTSPFGYVTNGQVSDNPTMLREAQVINRTGEVLHEVKFVPGAGDEIFTPNVGVTSISVRTLGSFGFTFGGAQPGSLQFEVTAIIEVETGSQLVSSVIPPVSRNTTNNVLSALGPPVRWAFSNMVVPTIKSTFTAAMQTAINGNNVASMGMGLLTL